MSKFNVAVTRARVQGPIHTEVTPSTQTYEGAPAYVRDAKSELFLLAVVNMVGENTFYESAGERDDRYTNLIAQVAIENFDWLSRMLVWLRSEANMRSAPLVGACEAVRARLAAGQSGGNRDLIAAVCQRADEPGEILAYWTSRYGRAVPQPIKRGVADAASRLFSERSLLKYDTGTKGFRFGDILELAHAKPSAPWQGDLFKHAIDRRHSRDEAIPESLTMLRARHELMAIPAAERRTALDPDRLAAAGMTWEALAGWLQGPMDAQAWEAIIPSMGMMSQIRNLRNFDEAGVSDEVAASICAKLSDPDQVARSRQFPFRFYSAYANAPSLRWGHALEKALALSVQNLPRFPGRTLVLVDTSASMHSMGLSARSKVTPATAAALFGTALAARGEQVDLVGFASGVFRHKIKQGASVLREMERFLARIGEVGHGTEMVAALRASFDGHNRVVLVSDMQIFVDHYGGSVENAVPKDVPMYGFNLGDYRPTPMESSSTRHELGGLTDSTFRMIPLLEAGQNADWPWAGDE